LRTISALLDVWQGEIEGLNIGNFHCEFPLAWALAPSPPALVINRRCILDDLAPVKR